MLILTFNLIQQFHPSLNTWWLVLLISIYFAFQDIFLIFGGLFVVLQIYMWLCARYMKIEREWNWVIYNYLLGLSAIFWALDAFKCDANGINYHTLWHITTALVGYFGIRIVSRYDYFMGMLNARDARNYYMRNN